MRTALEECESGPGNQISYRAGNQNLTRWSQRSDPGTHVHGESRDSRGEYFDFSRVHAGPHRNSEAAGAFPDRRCAPQSAPWAIECSQEPIAGGVNFDAAVPLELLADHHPKRSQTVAPRPIAELCRLKRRPRYVDEENSCEDTIGPKGLAYSRREFLHLIRDRIRIADKRKMVIPRQLDQLGSGYVTCQVAALLDVKEDFVGSV